MHNENLLCGFAGCGDCVPLGRSETWHTSSVCIPKPAVLVAISWQSLELHVASYQPEGPGVNQTIGVSQAHTSVYPLGSSHVETISIFTSTHAISLFACSSNYCSHVELALFALAAIYATMCVLTSTLAYKTAFDQSATHRSALECKPVYGSQQQGRPSCAALDKVQYCTAHVV